MILFLLALGVLLYAVERYSLEHVLDGLSLETATDRVVVEPGEAFSWTLSASNQKRFMIPYLEVREFVPAGLFFPESGERVEKTEGGGLSSVFYLAGRQKISLRRSVALPNRGRYFFRGSVVSAGDFMGLKTVQESRPELKEVVVKPKSLDSLQLSLLLGGFLGDHSVSQSLWEDPISTAGFREYTGLEPFHAISWIQSAKSGRLVVKQYERMVEDSCTVLLNAEPARTELSGEGLELCCSAARQICEELERRKISYSFRTNGMIAGAMGSWSQVGDGLGAGHLETVLEGLGRMTEGKKESAEEFLCHVARGVQGGRSFLIITSGKSDGFLSALERLRECSGGRILLFDTEEMEAENKCSCS